MANKFVKKEWVDRQSQYPSRRKLTLTSIENVYDVERAEGDVPEPGDAFDANNMNDIEDRIYNAFASLDATDIVVLDNGEHFTSPILEDVLEELFSYASNGKKQIANAIGGDAAPSDTFSMLSQKIVSGKKIISQAVGETKSGTLGGSESFSAIADFISKNKCSFSNEGSVYVTGETFPVNNVLWQRRISFNFGFTPTRIATSGPSIALKDRVATYNANFGANIDDNPPDLSSGAYAIGVKDLSSDGFTIWYKSGAKTQGMSLDSGYINFIAYGVPES